MLVIISCHLCELLLLLSKILTKTKNIYYHLMTPTLNYGKSDIKNMS